MKALSIRQPWASLILGTCITDNAVIRADGTGAATLQGSSINITDAATSTTPHVREPPR